jgi:hypothetical protein
MMRNGRPQTGSGLGLANWPHPRGSGPCSPLLREVGSHRRCQGGPALLPCVAAEIAAIELKQGVCEAVGECIR